MEARKKPSNKKSKNSKTNTKVVFVEEVKQGVNDDDKINKDGSGSCSSSIQVQMPTESIETESNEEELANGLSCKISTNEEINSKHTEIMEYTAAAVDENLIQNEVINEITCENAVEIITTGISSTAMIENANKCIEFATPSAPIIEDNTIMPLIIQSDQLTQLNSDSEKIPQTKSHQLIKYDFRISNTKLQPFSRKDFSNYYHCEDLDNLRIAEQQFLLTTLPDDDNLRQSSQPLYKLLTEYCKLHEEHLKNIQQITEFRKEITNAQNQIWVKRNISNTFTGKCGDNNNVKETVTYDLLEIDCNNIRTANMASKVLYDFLNLTIQNLISINILKAKITQMLEEFIGEIVAIDATATNETVNTIKIQQVIQLNNEDSKVFLRQYITIFFHFIRQSPCSSKQFLDDLKDWLEQLIAIYLKVAAKEDHWYLLFHILRCPSGIGSWAGKFLQIPFTTTTTTAENSLNENNTRRNKIPLALDSKEINHCLTTLQILLMPIRKRNEYLGDIQKNLECWTLVDSDGEDYHSNTNGDYMGLKENDLVILLNQISYEDIYQSAFMIEKFLDDYIITSDRITAKGVLTALAFSNQLIDIFGQGMLIYNTERYKQLSKRLGRHLKHILQYLTNYIELYKENNLPKNLQQMERIAFEFHILILKTCRYIYQSRSLSTWQYLTTLNYSQMHTDTIWQIFYYLNTGFPNDCTIIPAIDPLELINASDFWYKFNANHADSNTEDLYYILQTFGQMALDRDLVTDDTLIRTLSLHIFKIGYVNKNVRDICYKLARDILVNLANHYEDLITVLIELLKTSFEFTDNVAYLFKFLPLDNWRPSMKCFEIISSWLLQFDLSSSENLLARIIISRLNWDFGNDGELFLSRNIQIPIACLICEALGRHAPDLLGISSNWYSESIRQSLNVMDGQISKEQFRTWCWTIVSFLRIHLMDQNPESVRRTLINPKEALGCVSQLEQNAFIHQGVNDKHPLLIYVAILSTLHGHLIPLICQNGFQLMEQLLTAHQHATVIRCLELIIPLFIEAPDTLANCESFRRVLNNLLIADKTYIKMAKDIIYPNAIGPILQHLENMLHFQITSYMQYGLSTPLNLINVWLHCLTSLPNWSKTYVVYLLDKILSIAYQFNDAQHQCIEFFKNYYKNYRNWKDEPNRTSFLKSLFHTECGKMPQISASQPWLALVLLTVEFQIHDVHIWTVLLKQLGLASTSNLDGALKEAFEITKQPTFAAKHLCLYKYANLAGHMDVNHILFPIINQKFFELYLSRIPYIPNEHSFNQAYGVASKFYKYDETLMQKLNSNLQKAKIYYEDKAKNLSNRDDLCHHYRNCAKLMDNYRIWLEDKSIDLMTLNQHDILPKYNYTKLEEIFKTNCNHWKEYLYLPAIRKEHLNLSEKWSLISYRFKNKTTKTSQNTALAGQAKEQQQTPIERIKILLNSYETRLPPPEYRKLIHLQLNTSMQIDKNTLNDFDGILQFISNFTTKLHKDSVELIRIKQAYMDTVKELYKITTYSKQIVKGCDSFLLKRHCAQPARITVETLSNYKDVHVQKLIDSYDQNYEQQIDDLLKKNYEHFAENIMQINCIIRCLSKESENASKLYQQLSIRIFYKIIDYINKDDYSMKYEAIEIAYTQALKDLAVYIREDQENQGLKILQLAFERPNLLETLTETLAPSSTKPKCFIQMYKFLIDSYQKRCNESILTTLLAKFDLELWTKQFNLYTTDIEDMLKLIMQALENGQHRNQESDLVKIFRHHLIYLYDLQFPKHYARILQLTLDKISQQQIPTEPLIDLLNALLSKANSELELLHSQSNSSRIQEICMNFAITQTVFTWPELTNTALLFTQHFQNQRLQNCCSEGGLYPVHQPYCPAIGMWLSCIGHSIAVKAFGTKGRLLEHQIIDTIFGSIIDMYSPWLIPYNNRTMPQLQHSDTDTMKGINLYPWSENCNSCNNSKIMIQHLINTITFILNKLPSSQQILMQMFNWYIHNYTTTTVDDYILKAIHDGVKQLPWETFQPQIEHIDALYNILQMPLPEVHEMLGHIFLNINWSNWFLQSNLQANVISQLFNIFIKMSFKTNLHTHTNTSKLLEDALNYPWYLVDFAELNKILKWLLNFVEPSIILKSPLDSNYVDRAVLDLIRTTCTMTTEFSMESSRFVTNATQKRILYSEFIVQLHRNCALKNTKLLTTKNGRDQLNSIFHEFIETLDNCIQNLITENKTLEEQHRIALNLLLPIILPMQNQNEETSNLHIECLTQWLNSKALAGNILMLNILTALMHVKTFTSGLYDLLETSIIYYLRNGEDSAIWHQPTWLTLLKILQPCFNKLQLMPLINKNHLFSLHIFILYYMDKLEAIDDRIIFMQDLCQLLEMLKIQPLTEPAIAMIWCNMICCGCRLIKMDPINSRKPLFMMAKYLQIISNQTNNWGNSILNAIGLKDNGITNQRRILSRALAIVIFSLFPVKWEDKMRPSEDYDSAMRELSILLSNKKFLDCKSLIIQMVFVLKKQIMPALEDVPNLLLELILLCYDCNYLKHISDIWQLSFNLNAP